MSEYLYIVYFLLIGGWLVDLVVELLNLKRLSDDIPKEFQGWYEPERYKKSQAYTRSLTLLDLSASFINLVLIVTFVKMNGFNVLDQYIRSFGLNTIFTGILFILALVLATQIINWPFGIIRTFVIESKFGFNKTTLKAYLTDLLKGAVIFAVLGIPLLASILLFFERYTQWGWLLVFVFILLVQIAIIFVAPVVIMPWFNKFTVLPDGELKTAIEDFAIQNDFKVSGLFVMDGSKRSSKANAFFTGIGKNRRIVLFDTLVEKHSTSELVAILAHEIGHYKKKHIVRQFAISSLTLGFTLFILGLFLTTTFASQIFQMDASSIYSNLVFFGFFYSPISATLSVFGSVVSRKYEFEADAYAVKSFKNPQSLIDALKKLSVENLSNLTPHPLKVFLQYSHPPILLRVQAIRNL